MPCSWAVGFALADLLATRVVPPGPSNPTCRSRIICSVITPAGSPDHGLSPGAAPPRRGCGGPPAAQPDRVMPVRLRRARLAIFLPGRFVVPGPYMYKPPLTG